jgi:hypothetical protein
LDAVHVLKCQHSLQNQHLEQANVDTPIWIHPIWLLAQAPHVSVSASFKPSTSTSHGALQENNKGILSLPPNMRQKFTRKTRLAHYRRTRATLYNPPDPVTPSVESAWPVAILNVPTAPPRMSNVWSCDVTERLRSLGNRCRCGMRIGTQEACWRLACPQDP